MNVLVTGPIWRSDEVGTSTIHAVGSLPHIPNADQIGHRLPAQDELLEHSLRENRNHFAGIIDTPNRVIAFVDRVRSTPLFYWKQGDRFLVSNDARALQHEVSAREPNLEAVLEFAMAGYVTGADTVYGDIHQLRPGELLVWDREQKSLSIKRYYRYVPSFQPEPLEQTLIDELDDVIDSVVKDMIDSVGDRRIVLFLSGGWDSRLLLAKLTQLGFSNLVTLGYGRPNNHEMQVASEVARVMDAQWHFVPSPAGRGARRTFRSARRVQYWNYADGLSSTPIMHDYMPLVELSETGFLRPSDVIVNGLSGDFISGGHIPSTIAEKENPSNGDLLDAILDKHYSLWKSLKTPDNLAVIKARIERELPDADDSKTGLASRYEAWECQERQCKYMINNERLYEFLGCEWRLPLWDGLFVDFWQRLPLELKYRQNLYLTYLRRYDYRGVFTRYPNPVWRGYPRRVTWPARAIGTVFGPRVKEGIYKRMLYFGPSAHEWSMHGFPTFLRTASSSLHTISLFSRAWLLENGFDPYSAVRPN